VREQLLSEIWSGRWQPGDHLPTEPELMRRFAVSRAPVREAMQSLQLLGIVDISPRPGATVRALPIESVIDLAILAGVMDRERSIHDVFGFRHASEGEIAGLAARHATDDQLAELRAILLDNQTAVASGDVAAAQQVDVRFHAAIAAASGNVVFRALAAALNGLFFEVRRMTGGIPGAPAAALEEHRRIFEAINRRDRAGARRTTRTHIHNTEARYGAAQRRGWKSRDDVLGERGVVELNPKSRPIAND
jgi:DNA-binding FadR family transcriptional regulator